MLSQAKAAESHGLQAKFQYYNSVQVSNHMKKKKKKKTKQKEGDENPWHYQIGKTKTKTCSNLAAISENTAKTIL